MRVRFELSETDRNSGAYYLSRVAEWEVDVDGTTTKELNQFTIVGDTGNIGYLGDIDSLLGKVVAFRSGSYLAKNAWTSVDLTIYDSNGRYVTEYTYAPGDDINYANAGKDIHSQLVGDDYTVEISFMVDNMSYGDTWSVGESKQDTIDDRDQAVITVLKQKNPFSSVYLSATEMYVVNKGDNVQALIEDGTYGNFPTWDDADSEYYDAKNDVEYVRVYDNALTKVTEDITVKADWAEDKAGLDRFAPAATNDKDTNGDGKVSCDEYYGTTGLEWSDKLNACVVSSTGDAVVTIPNTATK